MRQTVIVLCVLALLDIAVARGQLNRSAVSVTGSDSNACTPGAPCRSIQYALTQTNAGGELIVLTSGGYGVFTVYQTLTVEAAPGIYAGITATGGYDAIVIDATPSETVVLRGLSLNAAGGFRPNGIRFRGGAKLYVEHCFIQGFGVGISANADIGVTDTTMVDCSRGIWLDNVTNTVKATVDRVYVLGHSLAEMGTYGVTASRNADVSVSHTIVADFSRGFYAEANGRLNLESCIATHNDAGVYAAAPNGFVRISNTTATDNAYGFYQESTAIMETWGNNRSHGNTMADVWAPLTYVQLN